MASVTKEIKGIKITLDPNILDDWDVQEALMTFIPSEDDDVPPKERFFALKNLCDILLGDDFEVVREHLRENNNGVASLTDIANFMAEIFEKFRAKN